MIGTEIFLKLIQDVSQDHTSFPIPIPSMLIIDHFPPIGSYCPFSMVNEWNKIVHDFFSPLSIILKNHGCAPWDPLSEQLLDGDNI